MPFSELDIQMMQRALELAKRGAGYVSPNPLVGCVITDESGNILGEGAHLKYGEAHAEPNAIGDAESKGHSVEGSTVYVTLEPHSHQGKTQPCSELLVKKKIARCVAAMEDPYPLVQGNGFKQLREAGIVVDVGLFETVARELNRFFIKYVTTGLPYVTLKLASSLDGRSALANGESRWITGEASRKQVHQMRSEYDAVMIGARTAIADDPELTVRLVEGRQPWRVVLDAKGELPASLKLLTDIHREKTIVINSPVVNGRIDLLQALQLLAKRNIASVLVEAGPTLAASMIASDLVDEVVMFVAPIFLGGDARPNVGALNLARLTQAKMWHLHETEILEDNVKLSLRATS